MLTDDTLFEDTSPRPDGHRLEGEAAVVAFWREWFARNPDAHFEIEEMIVSGDRGTCVASISSPFATGKWPRSAPM